MVTCWERADLVALLTVMFSYVFVNFSCGVLGVPRRYFFCGYFLLFVFHVCHAGLWSSAGKGMTSLLSSARYFLVLLSLSHMVSWDRCGRYLIVSIPDRCHLPYFACVERCLVMFYNC